MKRGAEEWGGKTKSVGEGRFCMLIRCDGDMATRQRALGKPLLVEIHRAHSSRQDCKHSASSAQKPRDAWAVSGHSPR